MDRVQPYESINDLIAECPKDKIIGDNFIKAWYKINSQKYNKVLCTVSGGSDSDIVIDICRKCDKDNKIEYVWFDTGLEYQATKEHLKYLEKKYGIEIKSYSAIKSIPKSCREYGEPFLSKQVSEFMKRLQKHDFRWEDKPFDELIKEYPKCKSALEWWCGDKGENSMFNISRNKCLKEFIVNNPPDFKISGECCKYAKKDVSIRIISEFRYDLNITGIRKAEGGVRSAAYHTCFSEEDNGCDNYRPIFWYKDQTKKTYERHYGIIHSRCYTEYGLSRTGCAGCPFGKNFEFELQAIKEHEPKLLKAVNNIFGKSYEYTRKYKEFIKIIEKTKEESENGRQMDIFDFL